MHIAIIVAKLFCLSAVTLQKLFFLPESCFLCSYCYEDVSRGYLWYSSQNISSLVLSSIIKFLNALLSFFHSIFLHIPHSLSRSPFLSVSVYPVSHNMSGFSKLHRPVRGNKIIKGHGLSKMLQVHNQ